MRYFSSSWIAPSAILLLAIPTFAGAQLQMPAADPAPTINDSASLNLDATSRQQFQQALAAHDYRKAEELLLSQLHALPKTSLEAATSLRLLGTVYFLDHDPMQAAVAWKKAEAIAPLPEDIQFSLAMAYIQLGHKDWAHDLLSKLQKLQPKSALYPYWLGRLAYDNHLYPEATELLRSAVAVDPKMSRAWDNLGLCLYYQNQNDEAIASFHRAIDLDAHSAHPSPWPFLNLAIVEQFLNRDADAEAHLRKSLSLDDKFPQAHFQLGLVLENQNKLEDALKEISSAALLDAAWADPHMAMARIAHKLGHEEEAKQQVLLYRKLHSASQQ